MMGVSFLCTAKGFGLLFSVGRRSTSSDCRDQLVQLFRTSESVLVIDLIFTGAEFSMMIRLAPVEVFFPQLPFYCLSVQQSADSVAH